MHGHRFADAAFGAGFGAGFGRGRGGRGRPTAHRRWTARRWPAGSPAGCPNWFTGPVDLIIDRDEITVVGTLAEPDRG